VELQEEAMRGHALHASQGSEMPAAAAEQQAAMWCHRLSWSCYGKQGQQLNAGAPGSWCGVRLLIADLATVTQAYAAGSPAAADCADSACTCARVCFPGSHGGLIARHFVASLGIAKAVGDPSVLCITRLH
jgi:hypothetical protein